MVSNLQQTAGVVSLVANSEENQLFVTFNEDSLTVDDIIAQLQTTGDEVTDVEIRN